MTQADTAAALAECRARFARAASDLTPPVVVGCSGGSDSVALLALSADAGLAPIAVHVDHGIRPDSAREQAAVSAVAARLGAPFDERNLRVEPGSNLEARARAARYGALESARMDHGATVVLVGHTADDQAETVLLNILRGAATAGVSGMPVRRDTVVRPLLEFRRADTDNLCQVLGLPVLHDPMNDDETFRRVAVRRHVLPLLERVAGRDLVPLLVRQAAILRDESDYLDELARAAWPGPDGPSARTLAAMPPVLARRAVRLWIGSPPPSSAEVTRVLQVAAGDRRGTELSGGRRVRRSEGQLSCERHD